MTHSYKFNGTFNGTVVPMFAPTQMEQPMANKTQNNAPATENKAAEQAELSVFDVKELYDLAYTYKTDEAKFKSIMSEAVKMDMQYRRQIAQKMHQTHGTAVKAHNTKAA